jgi:hypothetical protein
MLPKELLDFLPKAFKVKKQVLLVGAPGVGKTDMVRESVTRAGAECLTMHPAIGEPTDFKGLPAKAQDADHATFLPYGELWELVNVRKLTVCFIDDLGQATEAVQKALMHLLRGRHVNGHHISEQVVFCGATNNVGQRAGVTGIIEPVKSRWDSIINVENDIDGWTNWAIAHDMPAMLIAFLRTRPELLHQFEPTRELVNGPCPRTWEAFGRWINDDLRAFDVLAGAVGKGPATEYLAFEKLASTVSLDAILLDPDNEAVPEDPSLRYAVVTGLARKASRANMERIMRYLTRLPQAFRVLGIKDARRWNQQITQTTAFTTWAASDEARSLAE